jgi:ABC-2 type transport system permease protein
MRAVRALLVDTLREARASYTFLLYGILSTIFLLILQFALSLDVVDGTLAAGTLFGQDAEFGRPGQSLSIETFVGAAEGGFAGAMFMLGFFVSVFAIGSLVPHLVEKGTIDLYLARPVGRTKLLLSRFVGGILLNAINLLYLVGGTWVILSMKTGIWNPRFLVAGAVILGTFVSFQGFVFLMGVLSGSTPVSIITPYALFVLTLPLAAHEKIEALVDSEWAASLITGLYWALPKTPEIFRNVFDFTSGRAGIDWPIYLSTAAFGLVCLSFALLRFGRRDY